jgi:conjugal transfer ATP-binding protein TraC
MNQSEGIVETFPCFDAFVRAMPGAASGLRPKKMKTSNVAHLMPLYSYWEGNKRPVCLFPNRDNALLSIDPFEPSLPNWNGLVIGSSGAGKSFTLLQLVLMFYGQTPRPKIVWLDKGASSKNIVDCLDGQFVELNLDSGICLNPFDP